MEVCANIGPRERSLRNRVGVIGLVATVLLISALIETHAAWYWRVLIVLPAYISAMGFFQARAKTCVAFARAGIRVLGDSRKEAETVDDAMSKAIAAQARRVYLQATVAVAAVTLLVVAIP